MKSAIIDVDVTRRRFFRGATASSIWQFSLNDFNINQDEFLKFIIPTYKELDDDRYDVLYTVERVVKSKVPNIYDRFSKEWLDKWNDIAKVDGAANEFWLSKEKNTDLENDLAKVIPLRKRSCFQYLAVKEGSNEWRIKYNGVPVFRQNVGDNRSRERIFTAPRRDVYTNKYILNIIGNICEAVNHQPTAKGKKLCVTFHQMMTYATEKGSEPAPEGMHQDGSSFIVSAMVIERNNIVGGESKIFLNKNADSIVFNHVLEPGEGILQSDINHDFWHRVEPIYLNNKIRPGYRSTIGFDIDFIN